MKNSLQIIREHYAASARGEIAGMMAKVAPNVHRKDRDSNVLR